MNLEAIGLILYVILQLVISAVVARNIKTEDDYLLAGRRLGFGLATFTFFATWFGAETCIGAAGSVYERGFSGGYADPFGYGVCLVLMGAIFAIPLWRRKLTTVADLYRVRYSPNVERIAVLLMIPTSVLWAAAQIRAFSEVLGATTKLQFFEAVTAGAIVCITYTSIGGMKADVITDLIQGIMLIIGLLILAGILLFSFEGIHKIMHSIPPNRVDLVGGYESVLAGIEDWAIPICGSITAQELVARVLSIRSPKIARNSAISAGVLYVLVGLIPVGCGLIGAILFPNLSNPEQVLPTLAKHYLPTLPYIVFVGALFSAILSTVDSTLLAAAGLGAHNLIFRIRPDLDDFHKVKITRISVIIFGIIAWIIALKASSVLHLVEDASSFGSCGLFVTFVFGIFSKFGGAKAALCAIVTGFVVWFFGKLTGTISYPYITALAVSAFSYLAVGTIEKWSARRMLNS